MQALAGTANNLTHGFSRTSASQIASLSRSNGANAWGGHVNVSRAYTNNGLNQVTQSGSVSLGHDATGNITSAGTSSYVYNSRNLMTSATGVTALQWDPLNRLYMVLVGTTETKFQYDGQRMIAEFDTAGYMLRRYVHGPGVDEPLLWYEGSGTSDRRWLHADERGSIVAVTDGTGAVMTNGINTYDSYGIPGANNLGRFGYTGQAWIPELGMWYYKARIYSPTLGRFMQPDPIGYGDGMNLYAYVRGDPVNARDPSGTEGDDIVVTAPTCAHASARQAAALGCIDNMFVQFFHRYAESVASESGGGERGGGAKPPSNDQNEEIVVTGTRLAQLAIPIPRRWPFPLPPWILPRNRRGSDDPPAPSPPPPRRGSRRQCDAELVRNQQTCSSVYPPWMNELNPYNQRNWRACMSEAAEVYARCLKGTPGKPFDPYLFK